eukprot:NODE_4136_length_812_cov_57.204380_g4113_i0.p1 GENE.NODE_4136_length_812_cov_57.204380_g4113_i0~~NODE_4136_length_812_cov_57.204380_g4113_i0.p1  ORF type:complete len:232 (-),score=53.70 NODE_4136_length_812_cov_57.204380_g4113_i0:61-756(-)
MLSVCIVLVVYCALCLCSLNETAALEQKYDHRKQIQMRPQSCPTCADTNVIAAMAGRSGCGCIKLFDKVESEGGSYTYKKDGEDGEFCLPADASFTFEVNFKKDKDWQNDHAREIALRNVCPGFEIRLYDHPEGKVRDDWLYIRVNKRVSEIYLDDLNCFDCATDNYVAMGTEIWDGEGNGNGLKGKVSYMRINGPLKRQEGSANNLDAAAHAAPSMLLALLCVSLALLLW